MGDAKEREARLRKAAIMARRRVLSNTETDAFRSDKEVVAEIAAAIEVALTEPLNVS
jgi:hypothetical protein